MRTIHVVAGEDDGWPVADRPDKRGAPKLVQYKVTCRGLTRSESSQVSRELGRHFLLAPGMRRNPATLHPEWHSAFHILLVAGGAAGSRLLNVLESIVKQRLVRGEKTKSVILYGPDDKPIKRFRKTRLR